LRNDTEHGDDHQTMIQTCITAAAGDFVVDFRPQIPNKAAGWGEIISIGSNSAASAVDRL
jgi:hypothetical protein